MHLSDGQGGHCPKPKFAATVAAQGPAGYVEVVGDRLGGEAPVRHYDLAETGEPEVDLAPVLGRVL